LRPAVNQLLDTLPVRQGMRLLDAATGTGIAAIEAASRGASVVGVDFAADLVEEARRLADKAGAGSPSFEVADIESLPFEDESFDAVVSSFGAIFAPRHDIVAWQMARVLRPGGTLAFTSWVPEGPNYCLMTLTSPYVPPPPKDAFSVFDWGRPDYVRDLLSPYFTDIEITRADVPWHAESPSDAFDMIFNRALGPTVYVFRRLSMEDQLAIHNSAIALFRECLTPDGAVNLPREYLLIRAAKRRG
jgi:2-polyprenyl-6-hydroxyphenyl methylase/3-demethylubiquinone-9 3-methyltransferase